MYAAALSLPGVPVSRPASASLARYTMSRRMVVESAPGERARPDPGAGTAWQAETSSAASSAGPNVVRMLGEGRDMRCDVVRGGVISVCYPAVKDTSTGALPTLAYALIPRAVALNLALGAIAGALKLPVYLDSVGTILVAALAGPWAAIITGVASNSVLGLLFSPQLFAFIPVAVVIGALAGIAARLGAFRSLPGAVAAGLVIGLAAALTSVPIVIALFGGATPSGTGILTVALRTLLHLPLDRAAEIASLSTDLLDKPVSCVLVVLVLDRLPRRLTARLGAASL